MVPSYCTLELVIALLKNNFSREMCFCNNENFGMDHKAVFSQIGSHIITPDWFSLKTSILEFLS